MADIESLKKRKKEILRRIELSEARKQETLRRSLDRETTEKWLEYYDNYIRIYKKHLEICENEIKKQKLPKEKKVIYILIFSILIVSILIFISIFPVLKPLSLKARDIGEKISVSLEKIITPEIKEAEKAPEVPAVVPTIVPTIEFVEPKIEVSLEDKTVLITEESLVQYQAVLGKPVKWKKSFTTDSVTGFTIELPKGSENIEIKKIKQGKQEDITEYVDIGKKRNFLIFGEKAVEVSVNKNSITRNVVADSDSKKQKFEIIYETPAPVAEEIEISKKTITGNAIADSNEIIGEGKRIIITGPDDVHYKNILSFTELPKELTEQELGKFGLYQVKGNQRIETQFTAYDTDENGLYDYIEWITPELTQGEFLWIIKITKAQHLDSDRITVLSNIYEEVKALDGNWSETINDSEYVRVTFQIPLDNTRDITIYPRVVSGEPRIEVYEIDGSEKIAEFTSLNSNQYNKVLLTNLPEGYSQDVFDLKVVGGSLEIDYIVDPSYCGVTACASGYCDNLWISRVQFNTINNSSPTNDSGYEDFTSVSTNVVRGSSYDLKVNSTCSWGYCPDTTCVAAWIDFNQDGDFNDTGESFWNNSLDSLCYYFVDNPVFIKSITIPLSASNGPTRMRVILTDEIPTQHCNGANCPSSPACYLYGEVEDYQIIIAAAGTPVSGCRVLNQSNTVYIMNQSIINNTLTGACINISAQNITFDCGNYSNYIKSTSNQTGVYSNQKNTTIKNCNISMGTGSGGYGIYLEGANNSYVFNNVLNNQYYGLYLDLGSNNNQLTTITTSSNSQYGILLQSSSNSNTFSNINANNNSQYGIRLSSSSNNTLTNINANSNNNYGIWIDSNSNNTIIKDSNFSGNVNKDVSLSGGSTNNTFLNVSYNISKEYVSSNSQLIRKWYYQANITYNNVGVANANLSAYNNSYPAGWQFNLTSNSSGYTNITSIIDYVSNGTRNYYSNYTINTTNGSLSESHKLNVTLASNNSGMGKFGGLVWENIGLSAGVETDVTACRNLDKANTYYTQTANISSGRGDDNCINITAQNITLNCAGKYISLPAINKAGVYSNQFNTTIKNCNISMGSGSGGYGIYLYGANKSYIFNNTLNGNYYGLYLSSSSNNTLTNITANNNTDTGIYLESSSNNTLTNLNTSSSYYGLSLLLSSNNMLINININNNSNDGIYFLSSSNNNLINIIANNNDYYGIFLSSSSNNRIFDSNFFGNVKNDTFLTSTSINNTFLNVTYNISKEYVSSNSQLIRKWYYQANVSYQGQAVNNANLSAYNKTAGWQFNLTSNSSGFTNRTEIIDYINTGTRNYYSNYIIDTNNISLSESHKLNVTWKTLQSGFGGLIFENIVLKVLDTTPPAIWFENSTSNGTINYNNIFVNVSATDVDRGNNNISTFIDFNRSLVGWWRMDDYNATGIFDNSSYNNFGTFNGSLGTSRIVDGAMGKGLEFDGNGDYLNAGNDSNLNLQGALTLSAWIYPKDWGSGGRAMIIDKGWHNSSGDWDYLNRNEQKTAGFAFWIGNNPCGTPRNNSLSYVIYGGWVEGSDANSIKLNEWQHVLLVYNQNNEGNISFYINGVKNATRIYNGTNYQNCDGNLVSTSQVLGQCCISGDPLDSSKYNLVSGLRLQNLYWYNTSNLSQHPESDSFNGSIDDVMIFNRALSPEEVSALYANTSSKYLFRNFTNLAPGNYTFKAYAQDTAGNVNATETRQVKLLGDTTPPWINFTSPTPPNGNVTSNNFIPINVTANDSQNNISVFIDFNRSLVGWWRMDDVNQTTPGAKVVDYTGKNNGTAVGNAVQGEGYLGKGFKFDGDGDYVEIADSSSLDISKDFTLSAWIYIDSNTSSTKFIVGKWSDYNDKRAYGMWFTGPDHLNCGVSMDGTWSFLWSGYTTGVLNKEGYYHVACVYNTTSLRAYINRIYTPFSNVVSPPSYIATNNIPSTIGNHKNNSDSYSNGFNGSIDDVMIFNKALSPEEISALYANSSQKYLFRNFDNLVNGNYTFKAYAQDTAGNVNWTEERSVYVEETGPLVSKCRNLTQANTYYNLTQNLIGAGVVPVSSNGCIDIQAQNITFDCKGFAIINSSLNTAGVYSNQLNTTIKNCNITMNNSAGGYGIYLNGANNSYVFNNTLNNNQYGIYLISSSNNTLTNITSNLNSVGIYLYSSSNNTLTNITANSNNYDGIFLYSSLNNNLTNINANNNSKYGIRLYSSSNNILTNIISNNNYYGIFLYSSSNNNTLTNINASDNSADGIYLTSSSNNTLTKINANNNYYGISLGSSSNNILTNIISNNNSYYGIFLYSSSNNNTLTNIISNNNYYGIYLSSNSNNILTQVTANSNTYCGIYLSSSSNNRIIDSNLSNIADDVYLTSTSLNNTFLNVTYNLSKESVSSKSQLIRKWYYQANITYNNVGVANANLSAYNRTAGWQFNLTSNSSGYTNITTIIDYISNGTRNYYSLYTINTTNGSLSESHKLNVTLASNNSGMGKFGGMVFENIGLGEYDTIPPAIWFENSTSNGTINYNNIFVNVSATDVGRGGNNISTFIDFNRSLVGWWRMDDVNGSTIIDKSSYGNNATNDTIATNEAYQADGYLGKGFRFGESGENYIEVPDSPSLDITDQITLSAWVKNYQQANHLKIIVKRTEDANCNPWELYALDLKSGGGPGHPCFLLGNGTFDNGGIACGYDIPLDEWHFITGTWNGSLMSLYIDGVLNSTSIFTDKIGTNNMPITIGARNATNASQAPESCASISPTCSGGQTGCPAYGVNASIDDVMIFNRALSPEEISALYANSSVKYCYDNETEVMTLEGWKRFENVSYEDEILTLNATSGKTEWHNPLEKQDFAHDGEMYRIETEQGELLVSPEHKVYAKIDDTINDENRLIINNKNNLIIDDAESRLGINNKSGSSEVSPEHKVYVGEEDDKYVPESARGVLDSKDLYCPPGTCQLRLSRLGQGTMMINKNSYLRLSDISFVDIPTFILNNLSSYVHNLISLDKQSATKSSSFLCLPNNCFALGIKDSYSSNGTELILLNINREKLSNFSLESLDLDNTSSLCLMNSSLSFCGANIFSLLLNTSFKISPFEINILNSTLESMTTSIYTSPFFFKLLCIDDLTFSDNSSASFSVNLLSEIISSATNNSNLSTNSCTTLANANSNLSFSSGAISIFMHNSSILTDNIENQAYLSFSVQKNLSNFKLIKISEIYNNLNNSKNKQLFFLDEKGREIKVKSITKEDYNGRIYDLTVPNHIILVKRGDLIVWSGNSFREFTNLAPGNYTFKAYAQDTAGNVNWTEERNVYVEETGPLVSKCRNLTQANTYYNLTKSLIGGEVVPVSSKGCIDIQAQNITFDCKGFAIINSSLNTAGVYSNQFNTIIKNCNVSMGSGNGGYGIYLNGANNSYIFNNTLNNQYYGIYLESSSNNTFANITINQNNNYGIYFNSNSNNNILTNINTKSNFYYGIYLNSSSDNILTNITTNSSIYGGIFLWLSSNNTLTNINAGSNGGHGINLYFSSNNTLTNINAGSNEKGINSYSSSNNKFIDGVVYNSINKNDVNIDSISLNNTFLNVSYNLSRESVSSTSQLIRKWYYQANVTYNNIGVANANLSAYNRTSGWQFNLTSNSSGFTNITEIIDYISNGTRNYYSNYTINTTNGSLSESHGLNVTLASNNSGMGKFGGMIWENIGLGGNIAPQIIWVQNISNVSLDFGGLKNVSFNFTVYDGNGFSDLNDSSVKANFTKGIVARNSTNCTRLSNFNVYYANFSCTVGMWYFDKPGFWNISVSIKDNSGLTAINDSTKFNYNEGGAFDLLPSPTYINWTNVTLGGPDMPSDNNVTIRNLGNKDILNVVINATQLNGTQYTGYNITADKFKVNVSTSNICNGSQLSESQNVSFYLFINYSLSSENFPANKSLGFCLKTLTGIPVQAYKSARDWWIDVTFSFILSLIKTSELVFAVAVAVVARKKKRKKDKTDLEALEEKLKEKYVDFESLLSLDESLKEKYGLDVNELINIAKKKYNKAVNITPENLLEIFEEKLIERYDINIKEMLETVKGKEVKEIKKIQIPLVIFRENIGCAEVLCKYLKENIGLRFSEIAKLINRDERTVWINYRNAVKKKKEKIKAEKKMLISAEIFSDRRLSILESVVKYLKEKGLRNVEIAELLGKDQRNIYTLYSRAKKKL